METLKTTYVIFAAIIISLFCSCTKEVNIVTEGSVSDFILGTKADAASGTTFRIMAYSAQPENLNEYVASGTYSLQGKMIDEFPYLTASKLDDYGNIIESEDPAQALSVPVAQIGNVFKVSYVSPGIMHNPDGSFAADRSAPFYCSDIQEVVLNNYGKVEMTNELVDRRAKIGFNFYKDKEDKIVEIKDVQIFGTGDIYWPATKLVSTDKTIPVTLTPAHENSDKLVYICNTFDQMEFILSGKYSPKIKFKLSINGGGFLEMEVPLEGKIDEIIPLTTYIFNITVSHTYISTILEVTPLNSWEDIVFGFDIKDNSSDINLGVQPIGNWEDVNWNDNKDINSGNTN